MLNILFPVICNGCNAVLKGQEVHICTPCSHKLPIACFHRNNTPSMLKLFDGKVAIEQATALLYFQKKGITQELLHNLKYRGQQGISSWLGKWMGAELKESALFKEIDMVIPVPLHPARRRKRGYNQVSKFGFEISHALGVPFNETVFIKTVNTDSQVFKQRSSRFTSTEAKASHFKIMNNELIENKHILIVDDIITTGATLEACAHQLLKVPNTKISFATMAITSS